MHVAIFGAALYYLPRGFPLDNIHAWSDFWIPVVSAVLLLAALVRFVFMQSSGMPVALATATVAGGWFGAILTGLSLYPISFGWERAVGPISVTLALAALAFMIRLSAMWSAVAAVGGVALGLVQILGQRGPPPSTRPSGGTLADVRGEPTKEEAASGQVSFPCGKEHVRLRPLLTFESRSPDATWTVLAPPAAFGPRRKFDAFSKEKNGFRAHYVDDGETTLVAQKDLKGLDIEAVSKIPHAIYSHLNSFAMIHVPFESTISFGPTGGERFALEPFDYPSGRPIKLAYLGGDIAFHVVQATDAEKGPFTALAKGHLGRDEPLTIEIHHKSNDKDGVCRLTFKDWAQQVSTELSPTAGWGLPQNSIQFSASSDRHEGMVVITLAETGVGRGWHSVAHAEGTYKNRVRVDTVMDVAPSTPPKK